MAMIPLFQEEIVTKRKWMTDEEFVDGVALSQGFGLGWLR